MLIRVLIVEDDPLQAELTRHVLESQGLFAEVAASGLEAVRRMLAGWFDVVLMDHGIPDIDGVAVGRIIASLIRLEGRPRLIALSAHPGAIRARETGAASVFDAIMSKPWDPGALIAEIRRCHQSLPPPPRWFGAEASGPPVGASAAEAGGPGVSGPGVSKAGVSKAGVSKAWVPRVLVVDDDGALRAVVSLALRASGYQVDDAADGLDALRKILATPYDVAVVDHQMPEVDGLAASRLILHLIPGPERPRLVALTSVPERLMAREDGEISVFDAVVAKHSGIKAVISAVDACAEYRALRSRVQPPDVVRLDSILALGQDLP